MFLTFFSLFSEFILGSTLNIKAVWSSSNLPIAQKLNWYIKTCRVYDAKKKSGSHVTIIENMCYAQVIDVTPESENLVNADEFKFSYRSFSFESSGSSSQMIVCNVAFCIVDECDSQLSKINCDATSSFQWKSGKDF